MQIFPKNHLGEINIQELYQGYIKNAKRVGNNEGQYIGLCPFHNDNNPSYSFNTISGLSLCFKECFNGNAYQFADKMGHPEPNQYKEINSEYSMRIERLNRK